MWFRNKKNFPDVEVDIEHLPVMAIVRDPKNVTVISYTDDYMTSDCLTCSIEKHNELIARFRRKIGQVDRPM